MSQFNRFSNRQELRPSLRVDPSVVVRSMMLELPLNELDQLIETEINDNPALDRMIDENEPISEEQILKIVAKQELKNRPEDHEQYRSSNTGEELPNWVELAASSNSMREHVRAQVLGKVDPKYHRAATYVVDCLNDRGYLETAVEEISLALNLPLEVVDEIVSALHTCEPRGIGARSVTECLLLQLSAPATLEEQLARSIIDDHMDDLIARKTQRISRRFKVLPAVVESAFSLILELNPNPGENFGNGPSSLIVSPGLAVKADLVLARTEQGWSIEPRGGDPSLFRVDPGYKAKYEKAKKDHRVTDEEREHLTEYVGRAERFIQSLSDRRRTLRQLGEFLVMEQSGFIVTGRYEFLKSMTRAKVASILGVHESTISRATQGKFVQIDTGEVVAFDTFFKPALRIQKMIEEIVENENPNSPLSDLAITELLAKKGVHVARRTVNKYRDKTRMLNSRTRRSA